MRAEELRQCARFLLVFRLHLYKKSAQRVGIVTRTPHILRPKPVGLFLGAARELQEGQWHGQPQTLTDGVTAYPAQEDQRDRSVVEQFGFRRLLHAVTRRDVRDLVG